MRDRVSDQTKNKRPTMQVDPESDEHLERDRVSGLLI
jgi:hypothetical protein